MKQFPASLQTELWIAQQVALMLRKRLLSDRKSLASFMTIVTLVMHHASKVGILANHLDLFEAMFSKDVHALIRLRTKIFLF
jgi:hypothetical protein